MKKIKVKSRSQNTRSKEKIPPERNNVTNRSGSSHHAAPAVRGTPSACRQLRSTPLRRHFPLAGYGIIERLQCEADPQSDPHIMCGTASWLFTFRFASRFLFGLSSKHPNANFLDNIPVRRSVFEFSQIFLIYE